MAWKSAEWKGYDIFSGTFSSNRLQDEGCASTQSTVMEKAKKKKRRRKPINIGTTIGTSGKFSVKRDLSVNLFMHSDASVAVTL